MVDINEITDEQISGWISKRYQPKEGEPDLPPQLSEYTNKSTDEVIEELNRLPLFMTQLDEGDGEGGENLELEALKALAYEGEPDEIATNFKNQGNECYKEKKYKDAIEFYKKGLEIKCDVPEINGSLYLNRAACNLELKNYRRCINECKECLKIQPKNIKAFFRSAKAYFAIEKYDEAIQVLEYAVTIDNKNAAINTLLKTVKDKKRFLWETEQQKLKVEQQKEQIKQNLKAAIDARGMTILKTSKPSEIIKETELHLEDENDIESQLIFPAVIMYPTTDEFDFVAEISELTTPYELMELVLDRPDEYFEDPRHVNFKPKRLEAYMETESGGLIKVGKKVRINSALVSQSPKVPLFDNSLRIYFVPKAESADWINTWSKQNALEKRA
ncbi:hypothetical protein B5S31_g1874 [[Candida] boidinii]|nr:hypothetical protein B5S31_g1874 [[Candida] boidinii]